MLLVVGSEFIYELIDGLFFVSVKGSFHHVIQSIAYPRDDGSEFGNRPSVQAQDMIDRFRNISASINKRSVEVKEIEIEHRHSPLQ